LATLISVDPVYVAFNMDERTALRRMKQQREGKTQNAPVTMAVANETGWPRQGKFESVDTAVDPATGTLRCRAVFANPDGILMPGLFARIRLVASDPYKALLVPSDSIVMGPVAPLVWVVNNQDKVEVRQVKLGSSHEGYRVVTDGLNPDDRVIVGKREGVRPGSTVKPREESPRPSPGK
jgi:RND family efflux transporter MFP subunit